MQIAMLVGSLRAASINRRVAQVLTRLAPADVSFAELAIGNLPLYNQDHDATPAAAVVQLKQAIAAADGMLFVTPEYNRSIPGVLKNAIDHASRPYGHSAWAGKPAGIVGVSSGKIATATAQQHLRNVLAYLDMPILGQPEAFIQWHDGLVDEAGDIGAESRDFLQGWMDKFVAWVRLHAARNAVSENQP